MDEREQKRVSKFMSLVLRHEPGKIGIAALEPGGYVPVEALLAGLNRHGFKLTRAELEEVVSSNEKQRFSFDASGTRIRCNQGHSVEVNLQLSPVPPPDTLYHGTVQESIDSIRREGLKKMSRHAVHLSMDRQTASVVGGRRGKPVILLVAAGAMHADGWVFYRSENGVWLVDAVPPQYLREEP